jgi:NOL1/NOP2/fmu family ribosome biogenesis protein
MKTACLPTRLSSLLVLPLALFACDNGENPPIDESACPVARLLAESVSIDVDLCIDVATAEENRRVFRFQHPGTLNMTAESFEEVATLPFTLDTAQNGNVFGSFEHEGGRWDIAVGLIGGLPLGEASLELTAIDGQAINGTFEGVAVPGDENELFENVFLTITF